MILSKCKHPIRVMDDNHVERFVPCGKCESCLSLKAYQWKKRLDTETSCHQHTLTLTLTYDNAHLPYVNVYPDGSVVYHHFETHPTYNVSKSVYHDLGSRYNIEHDKSYRVPVICHYDLIEFINRLKVYVPNIRWFIQSELGPSTLRPHYHGLLFFSDYDPEFVKQNIYKAWQKCDWSIPEHQRSIHAASSTGYSTSYVASVLSLPKLHNTGRFKMFHYTSNRPPIGSLTYSKDEIRRYINGDDINVCRYDIRKNEYNIVPYLRSMEDKFFPTIPNYSLLNSSARKFLLNAYRYFARPKVGDSKIGVPYSIDSVNVFSARFRRFLEDYPIFKETLSLALQSDSSIPRIYRVSKKYYQDCFETSPLYVDYAFDAHYYRLEMAKLRQQYLYEEDFCNRRGLSPKFLIFKDPVFVSKYSGCFTLPPAWVTDTLFGYGYQDIEDFTSNYRNFCLDKNSDVQNYHLRIHEIIHESHKSKANNDYLEASKRVDYLRY